MYRFFVSPEQIGEHKIIVTGSDVKHIRSVLRMRPGEEIRICTGQDDKEYRCRIEQIGEDEVEALILWAEHTQAELPSKITLFQGLPKSDKMELIIQKAVELGAYEIVPVMMRRSIVKLTASKADARVKRWNAISESAAKQSKRMIIPQVKEVCTFSDAVKAAGELDCILLPYECAEDMDYTRGVLSSITPGQSIGIFIGPEGGFEPEEVAQLEEAGAKTITLGRRILRTETAGMTLLSALMIQLDR